MDRAAARDLLAVVVDPGVAVAVVGAVVADRPRVVAIDGPSGVGKSTIASLLGQALSLPVLDTGAMYRAVALKALESGLDLDDGEAVVALAAGSDLRLMPGADGTPDVWLDGESVAARIRTPEVSQATSRIATYPGVRERLVALQRAFAREKGAVMEGRDIGTVVFPDTPHKFYLDARPEVRAGRRYDQLIAAGKAADRQHLETEIAARDARDQGRAASPLTCDARYRRIDTSDRTPREIVTEMLSAIEAT